MKLTIGKKLTLGFLLLTLLVLFSGGFGIFTLNCDQVFNSAPKSGDVISQLCLIQTIYFSQFNSLKNKFFKI